MLNYPFLRLTKAFIKSMLTKQIKIQDKTIISMRCGVGDIDPYFEMNNGRYQQLADLEDLIMDFGQDFLK